MIAQKSQIQSACTRLADAGIQGSLFIDPELSQIEAAVECGAPVIEIHTGVYADASDPAEKEQALRRIMTAASAAKNAGLIVNAGHGLHYQNVAPLRLCLKS